MRIGSHLTSPNLIDDRLWVLAFQRNFGHDLDPSYDLRLGEQL